MKTLYLVIILTLHIIQCYISRSYSKNTNKAEENTPEIQLFQKLYKQKRLDQQDAVKSILKYETVKQYKLIDVIASKSFQVLEESQIKLRESGYVPGMDFPQDDDVREALSLCLESTAFMSEILLHLPDATHRLLSAQKSWTLIFTWGLFFASQSAFLDAQTKKLVYLASQELDIAEKDPNYVNPYVKKKGNTNEEEGEKKEKKEKIKMKKKKKKTFKKGPMLSRHMGEL